MTISDPTHWRYRIGDLLPFLVVLPLIHIGVSAAYLTGYTYGFGAKIGLTFSLDDLLNTGIQSAIYIYIYIGSAVFIAFIPFLLNFSSKIDNSDKIDNNFWTNIFPNIMFYVAIAFISLREIYQVYTIPRAANLMILAYVFIFPFITFLIFLMRQRKIDRGLRLSLMLLAMLLLMSGSFGLHEGHEERYFTYNSQIEKRLSCKSHAVLRKISGFYLAIKPNGRKTLLNEDCSIALDVPEPYWLTLAGRKALKDDPIYRLCAWFKSVIPSAD